MSTPREENKSGPGASDTSDYLWDRSGAPDPTIQGLEQTLGSLRFRRTEPFTVTVAVRMPRSVRALIVAAALALAAGIVWYAGHRDRPTWEVVAQSGAPTVDSRAIKESARLARGDWLETDSVSRATLNVPAIGSVVVEPGSKVRLVESREGREHRMELAVGTIDAIITAPPRLFFVDTPSAQAIDLGCMYRLTVLADGSSTLQTSFGLVEMAGKVGGREVVSRVPTGAACRTDKARGPGTPRFTDAPAELSAALDEFDAGKPEAAPRVLDAARAHDTLTLWHLLPRTDGAERTKVLERMVALAGAPPGVTDVQTRALEPAALEAWWLHLRKQW